MLHMKILVEGACLNTFNNQAAQVALMPELRTRMTPFNGGRTSPSTVGLNLDPEAALRRKGFETEGFQIYEKAFVRLSFWNKSFFGLAPREK